MAVESIDGILLAKILKGALEWLNRHRREIDALNVFPVPDGDTGSNMHATLEAAVAALSEPPPGEIAAVAETAARGALMGARGNSGVILSQVMQGFASALKGEKAADVQDIAVALATGADFAYRAVSDPVEGTILTVVRDAAREAHATTYRSRNLLRLLSYILKAATRSLAQTPELLPVLKEAGVVDAGGRGFTAILEGALQAAIQRPHPDRVSPLPVLTARPATQQGIKQSVLAAQATESINFTYCTEFLLKSRNPDAEALKENLARYGDCLLIAGEKDVLRIHIHTDHPGNVLEEGLKHGSLHDIRINNMRDQHEEAVKLPNSVAVVAVVLGDGFTELFANLGAFVVPGGQTMNPSAGEIASIVAKATARAVIVLPNNPNVILTAKQVKDLVSTEVHIVPTTTMPQGLTALLAFNPEEDTLKNVTRMTGAAKNVVTAEITRAVKTARIGERTVKEKDFIALVGDSLVACGNDLAEVTVEAAEKITANKDVVTLYRGEGLEPAFSEVIAARLAEVLPEAEVEVQYGGQPHYQLLVAAE